MRKKVYIAVAIVAAVYLGPMVLEKVSSMLASGAGGGTGAAGTGANTHDVHQCPSCGAALDKINAAGVCGYCDSRITSGKFDWVLSRIDQTEVYQG